MRHQTMRKRILARVVVVMMIASMLPSPDFVTGEYGNYVFDDYGLAG